MVNGQEPSGPSEDERFYDRHWEHADTSTDPYIADKAERVLNMIPDGVRTIADVGCGDGYLTARLAERYQVTAFDRSPVAVLRVKARGIAAAQASAEALPLSDRSVDLLFSSQMLEHLPDDVLARAAGEFERVAGRYLLVTVPHRENLRRRFARCPRCGHEFHVEGHLHALDGEALDRLFPRFRRVATALAGPLEPPTYARLEEARQRLARGWFVYSGLRLTCPRCGEDRFERHERRAVHRAVSAVLSGATSALNYAMGRRPMPYWILALYERNAGAEGA
jgi:SAM-dependent methyltransferase